VPRRCAPTCHAAFADCDPDNRNGCETPINPLTNCGACGNNRTALANTSSVACTGGTTCEITGCDAGFEDCDGMDSTGCEVNTRTLADCGGCSINGDNQVCMGLANATATSCSAGTCAITTCAGGFANCDGDVANGCERNTTLDGPCVPDTNCTRRTYGSNTYYFCTNNITWTTARDRCRSQRRGNLVHVDDMAENSFVLANRPADAWIGANDVGLEGTWRWINNGVPFWRGLSTGSTLLGQFARWGSGEPNESAPPEDCAEIRADGTWNDLSCTATRDFVCEETPDLCPTDSNKLDPGQCGCGNADTDADGDGFAACNDGCESDPNKNAPGQCGCGTAETDSDGDGHPDCIDQCPFNALSTSSASGCGLGFIPSNIDVTRLNPTQAGATTTLNCAAVLNTNNTPSFTTWCGGAQPQITLHSQGAGNAELAVVALRNLSIPAGGSLRPLPPP
jgi:hypothetical protein